METTVRTIEETFRAIPPKEMFRGESKEVVPLQPEINGKGGQLTTPITDIVFPKEGGVLVYHRGDLHPVKAWPFKEAIYAVDCVKRRVVSDLKFLTSSPIRYLLALFVLFPTSWKKKVMMQAIEQFTDFSETVFDRWGRILPMQDENGVEFGLQGVIWKPQFYCDMVREFRRVAWAMAGDDLPAQRLIEAICMFLEFDDAYRYRIQDGFGAIDAQALKERPAKELVRVLNLMKQRGKGLEDKLDRFIKVIPFLFTIRIFRETFQEFFARVDLKKLSLDEIDFYRCLLWGGHAFRGIPDQERASLRMMIDAEWQHYEKQKTK